MHDEQRMPLTLTVNDATVLKLTVFAILEGYSETDRAMVDKLAASIEILDPPETVH